MLGIILIMLGIMLLVMLLNLRSRVEKLEKKLEGKTSAQIPVPASVPIPTPAPGSAPSASLAPPMPRVAAVASQPSGGDRFVSWMTENWLLKLGALLLLMGFGWLITYAFLNNWIGPAGRIVFGLSVGALILSLGAWRMRRYVTQGSVFAALGAAVILLTTYGARSIYDFLTPTSALALMFLTSALVAFLSGIYNRKQLAVVSIALAGIAPILAHSPSPDYVGLFWYLLIVTLGSVWIAVWKSFREVVTAALIMIALYSMPLLMGLARADTATLLLFAYGFAAAFYVTNTAGLLRLKGTDATADLVTAAGNALLLLAWIYSAAPKDLQSLILAAWAVAFITGAFLVFRFSGQKAPLFLYAAIGIGYIAAATAIELSGAALTIAYTLESAVVAVVLFGLTKDVAAAQRATILLVGPVLLSFASIISGDWQFGVFNQHFFVLAILAATFFGLSVMFFTAARASESDDVRTTNSALCVVGSIYTFVLLWLSLHAALPRNQDMAVMIALFVYTVVGIAAYIFGTARSLSGLRAYGGVLLALVVGRLLLVDVWQMELTGRIITFFLIGTLLMSTAFLGRGKKHAVIHENIKV